MICNSSGSRFDTRPTRVNRSTRLTAHSSPEVLYEVVLLHVLSARDMTELLHVLLKEVLLVGSEPLEERLRVRRVVVEDEFEVHVYEDGEQQLSELVLSGRGRENSVTYMGTSAVKNTARTPVTNQGKTGCPSSKIVFGRRKKSQHQSCD